MRNRKGSLVTALILSFLFTLSPFAQERERAEDLYLIKQGDTLWDLSAKFLSDPFRWPKLWQQNSYITNPHWINPGNPVRFTSIEEVEVKEGKPPKDVEEKPRGDRQDQEVIKTEVKKTEVPLTEKKPEPVHETKPVEENRVASPEIRSAGFFTDINFRGTGTILESRDGKTLMATEDIVYLSIKSSDPISIGDKFTIFRPSNGKDPHAGQSIGRRYNITGNLQIIDQYGNFYTGKIIEAFDAVLKGDLVRPYWKEKMETEERKE